MYVYMYIYIYIYIYIHTYIYIYIYKAPVSPAEYFPGLAPSIAHFELI